MEALLNTRLPSLRPLEIHPAHAPSEPPLFAVRDMAQIATQPLAVSLGGYFVMMCLNGELTADDVIRLSQEQFGRPIEREQVLALVAALDEHFYLETPRFFQEYARRVNAYRGADARDSRERWPAADALRTELDRMAELVTPETRRDAAVLTRALRGLMVPHLDYERGGPCYAEALALLRAAPPAERYVILGTNHFGHGDQVVATSKDFLTPVGRVRCDRGLLERLRQRLDCDLTEHEFDHEQEHSIDLPLHLLQHAYRDEDFEIVPLLCPDPTRPVLLGEAARDAGAAELGDALAAELAADGKRTVLIASADWSHVGQYFGDEQPTSNEFLDEIGRSDMRLLGLLERRNEDDFLAAVRATENATRICSVGCIYALLRALPGAALRVLRYHQAASFEAETTVTCAAAVVSQE